MLLHRKISYQREVVLFRANGAKDVLYLNPKKIQNFKSRIGLFQDIQKLCFFKIEIGKFLKDLHLLRNLKVLMVERYYKNQRRAHRVTLKSNSLEKLSFKHVGFSSTNIESIDFNTQNLNSLVFWNTSTKKFPVNFCFPLTIRHLECIEFDSDIGVLKNLETLICKKIVCPFSLETFKFLQRLELFPYEETELDYIRRIVKEKKRLGRDKLEIIVCGLKDFLVPFRQSHEVGKIPNLPNLNEHYLDQVAKHPYALVGHIPWRINIYFPIFAKSFKEIPKDLFRKFVNIDVIELRDFSKLRNRKSPNDSYVLQLLKQSNPKDVSISFNFNPKFYEELTSIQTIETLLISDKFENLNYDHFLKLKYLNDLSIFTEKLPIDFVPKIFTLKFLNCFHFHYSNCSLIFYRKPEYYLFDLQIYKKKGPFIRTTKAFDDLDDLFQELEKLKVENKPCLRNCLNLSPI